MLRDIDLAFIKLHVLFHAAREEVFGVGLMEELGRHGYEVGPGTLYPTLSRMEEYGWLSSEERVIQGKVRKYYRATPEGRAQLEQLIHKVKELHHELVEEHAEHEEGLTKR